MTHQQHLKVETQHNDETTESDSDTDGEDNIELL